MHQPTFRSTPEADANPLLLQTLACTSTSKDPGQLLTCTSAHIRLHISHGCARAHICTHLTQVPSSCTCHIYSHRHVCSHMPHTRSSAHIHVCTPHVSTHAHSIGESPFILEQWCGFKVLLLLYEKCIYDLGGSGEWAQTPPSGPR